MVARVLTNEILDEIIRRIVAVSQPKAVMLFGSAASDTMDDNSDIDLLVLEEGVANTRTECIRIRRALSGLGFPVDVFIMKPEVYDRTKDVVGTLAYPVHKYGRCIYANR